MASETSRVPETGVATLSEEDWELARQRAEHIAPLAALDSVGHQAVDSAALALGISRRQVYLLIRRVRQGNGLLTDLVPGQSGGGKGKGRLSLSVERLIQELLQKRFLTRQKRSLAALHREVTLACKTQHLRPPSRNTLARRIARLDPISTANHREGMPSATCKARGAFRLQSPCHWSRYRSTTRSSI